MSIQILCWVNSLIFLLILELSFQFQPLTKIRKFIGELCMNVGVTLRNGGSVLIPCYPSGVVYDLFECLSLSLDSHGLSQVPMFFISPVADSSLAYSNILAEWLSSVKQNKACFFYLPV